MKDCELVLLARALFMGVSGVREGNGWYYLDAWTPDCERLVRQGYLVREVNQEKRHLCRLALSAKGRKALAHETARALAAEEDWARLEGLEEGGEESPDESRA